MLSHVQLFVTPWTVACQAPLSMELSRQEYWSGSPFPSLGHLSYSGIKPRSPTLLADSLPSEPLGKPQGGNIRQRFRSWKRGQGPSELADLRNPAPKL